MGFTFAAGAVSAIALIGAFAENILESIDKNKLAEKIGLVTKSTIIGVAFVTVGTLLL